MATLASGEIPAIQPGVIVNQVQLAYNAFGQLTSEYQEHGGAVNTLSTPSVGYGYADGSEGYIRPTQMVYPNGRVLDFGYNAGADNAANRVSFLADDNGGSVGAHLAEYQYLGLDTILGVSYPQPQIAGTFDVDPSAPGTYPGLDRFGRIVDLLWQNTATGTALERIQHGYDRVGNRLWRQCPVAKAAGQAFDELYAYDGVNRLASFQRGRLNTTQTALVPGSENFAQAWAFDATGNWDHFQQDDSGGGTWDLDQTRTHDPANEITSFAASAGAVWAQPAYDRNGSMLAVPCPATPTTALNCVYDAWNRLVQVSDAATSQLIATYAYDARGFRIVKELPAASGSAAQARHSYYNSGWRELEQRTGSPGSYPQYLQPAAQFVWGRRYIDDLVLRDRDADASGTLDERLYGIQDANWSVTALADTSAAIVERYRYDAYGEATVFNGTWTLLGPASAVANETLYTGRQLDTETRLYHYRMRNYGGDLGRFLRRDPIGYLGYDVDLYRYVRNAAVNVGDPFGLAGPPAAPGPQQPGLGTQMLLGAYIPLAQAGQYLTHTFLPFVDWSAQDRGLENMYKMAGYTRTQKRCMKIGCAAWDAAAVYALGRPTGGAKGPTAPSEPYDAFSDPENVLYQPPRPPIGSNVDTLPLGPGDTVIGP